MCVCGVCVCVPVSACSLENVLVCVCSATFTFLDRLAACHVECVQCDPSFETEMCLAQVCIHNRFTCSVSVPGPLPSLVLVDRVQRCCNELFHALALDCFHGKSHPENRKTRPFHCSLQPFVLTWEGGGGERVRKPSNKRCEQIGRS